MQRRRLGVPPHKYEITYTHNVCTHICAHVTGRGDWERGANDTHIYMCTYI